jgi:SPP1 family predicted phage head-tail adaptor
MMKINVGELRDKITISKREEVLNDSGFSEFTYVDLVETRGKIKTQSTKEYFQNDTFQSELTYKVITRRRRDFEITHDMFVKCRGKMFNIKHINEIDLFFIEMTITEVN